MGNCRGRWERKAARGSRSQGKPWIPTVDNGTLLERATQVSHSGLFRQYWILMVLCRQGLGSSSINAKFLLQVSSLQFHACQGLVKLILIRCLKATNALLMAPKDKPRVCGRGPGSC